METATVSPTPRLLETVPPLVVTAEKPSRVSRGPVSLSLKSTANVPVGVEPGWTSTGTGTAGVERAWLSSRATAVNAAMPLPNAPGAGVQ